MKWNLWGKKCKEDAPSYNPVLEKPIVKSSICTGEKTAGFKDIKTGKYRDVVAIKSDTDLREFMKKYNLDSIDTEY